MHCSIVAKKLSKLSFYHYNSKQGGVDCGLFAAAFIQYILSEKKNLTNVSFMQSSMTNHTWKCLKNNNLEMFPGSENCAKNRKKKLLNCPYIVAAARFGWSLIKTYLKSKCSNFRS